MSRKKYLMLSKQLYIDMENRKFITKSERLHPNNTYIPKFLWDDSIKAQIPTGFEMKNGKLVNTVSNNIATNVIELYGIRIEFYNHFRADINIYDNRKRQRLTFTISGNPYLKDNRVNSKRTDKLLDYVDLTIGCNGASKVFRTIIEDRELFKPIGYLGQDTIEQTSKANSLIFNYGLLNNDFKIEYLGKELNGSCYAFIYDMWAILLKDDLSFDALVTLKGYNHERLIINKFIYTSNVYLIKIITLYR